MQFRKPLLVDHPPSQVVTPLDPRLERWIQSNGCLTKEYVGSDFSPPAEIEELMAESKNGVVIAGPISNYADQLGARQFIDNLGWPVLAEPASGLGKSGDRRLCSVKNLEALPPPECVIRLGALPTLAKTLAWLSSLSCPVILISDKVTDGDPYGNLSHRLRIKPQQISLPLTSGTPAAGHGPLGKEFSIELATPVTENSILLGEVEAISTILAEIPEDFALYLGNSLPIRIASMANSLRFDIPVGAHRGVSGIDGTIAVATGYCLGLEKPTVLIVGDLTFLHDLTSLYTVKSTQVPLTIIVINNNGGGIFNTLEDLKDLSSFERILQTPHDLTMRHACEQFGLNYKKIANRAELNDTITKAFQDRSPKVIEIQTDPQQTALDLARL